MNEVYQPKQYWERRLGDRFSLRGVGHIGFSESYNRWLYRRKRRCIESCFIDTNLKGKHVLDIGCGTGFFVEWYLEQRANVRGIDITSISVQRLKQKHQCEFYTQDITDPDYPLHNRDFDIANMWDVVYHIVDPQRFHQAFDNIATSAIFALGQSGDRSAIPILQEAFERSNAYEEELQKKRKGGGSEDEQKLREKYGLGAFDLRQTLQEAIDTLQKKPDKVRPPTN